MAIAESITPSVLREHLSYDPNTGLFTRLKSRVSKDVGKTTGSINADGYIAIKISGKSYLSHRLAWFYSFETWPKNHIDHINGTRTDNRLLNLRDVSASINQQNRHRPESSSKSGLLGVSLSKGRWHAQITISNFLCKLGSFESKEMAFACYMTAKKLAHQDAAIVSHIEPDLKYLSPTAIRNLRRAGILPISAQ